MADPVTLAAELRRESGRMAQAAEALAP